MTTQKFKKVNLKYRMSKKLAMKFNVCYTVVSLAVNGTLNSETLQKFELLLLKC